MKKLFVRALSLVIILTLLISCFSVSAFASKGVSPNNWMSAVKSSTPITAINIPGTHDTATQYVTASYFSQTQSLSIKEQLDIGVRYFDIRLEKTENDFIAVHGITDCKEDSGVLAKNLTAGKIIEYCRDFLKSNPTETILFQIKEDDGDAGTAFFDSFYDLYIKDSRSLWFTENRIPTLGEVRGKIVLLRVVSADTNNFDDSNSGINFSTYPYIGGQEQYDYRRCDISKLNGNAYASMYVQDSYRLEGDKKWTAVKDFLDSDLNPKDFNICMTNCTGKSNPKTNAEDINARLLEYDFEKGKSYGIITTDFTTAELAELIFTTNSAVEIARTPDTTTVKATEPTSKTPDKDKPTVPTVEDEETATVTETEAEQTAPEAENEETTAEVQNENTEKSNKTPIIIGIAVAVLFLGVAGGLTYYFIKKRQ